MFARVSTYKTGPETVSDSVPDETVQAVLAIPGCQGIYYLSGKDGKDLSITLWDSEESIAASREAANRIRNEVSAAEKREIVAVEEFEVTASSLRS
ncbi:hypothetical protein ACFWIX_02500 [Pseudarthrobacter sp. NPDC058362]|uniref:hypothetical protein n=1 Tax=unclassified Pseudarthrobacter TaxID=2647000 RepID=UPI00364CA618